VIENPLEAMYIFGSVLQIGIEGDDSHETLLQRALESRQKSGAITPSRRMAQHMNPFTEVHDALFNYVAAPVR
jgi:hypothetical protein